MSRVADIFKKFLDQKEIKYTYFEPQENRKEAIRIGYSGKNASDIQLLYFFDDNANSVNVKVFDIAKIAADKLMNVYVLLNELNCEYRWVKFYVDSDNQVTVSGDAITDEANAGEELFEILVRYIQIIDEVYPRIMKAIWA